MWKPYDDEDPFACFDICLIKIAYTGTLGHTMRPLKKKFTLEVTIEERLVVDLQKLVDIDLIEFWVNLKLIVNNKFISFNGSYPVAKLGRVFRKLLCSQCLFHYLNLN